MSAAGGLFLTSRSGSAGPLGPSPLSDCLFGCTIGRWFPRAILVWFVVVFSGPIYLSLVRHDVVSALVTHAPELSPNSFNVLCSRPRLHPSFHASLSWCSGWSTIHSITPLDGTSPILLSSNRWFLIYSDLLFPGSSFSMTCKCAS